MKACPNCNSDKIIITGKEDGKIFIMCKDCNGKGAVAI